MKKLLLVLSTCLFALHGNSQATSIYEAPQNNLTTTQLRAPNGLATSAYMRACALVLQTELGYIPNGSTLTTFGFTLTTSSSVSTPVAGNFTLYLQNTTDVANNKGTTWSTIPTGMTVCYASILTIPIAAATTSVVVTLSTPFAYTGGGLYVAYDWYSAGPYSTAPATFWAENAALTTGCSSSVSATGAPATLTSSNFRPSFLFGFANPYVNDVAVYAIEAPGRIAGALGITHTVGAWVKNMSNVPLSNITLTASAAGANVYANTQTVSSLAAGATTFVTFGPFNPAQPGSQTISVTPPNDNYNPNNSKGYLQEVTCDIMGQGPAVSGYSFNSVGFNTGAGIISTPFNNVATNTLVGIRGAVSTNTAAVGNAVYGVLMSSAGAIIATSNNLVITNAMLGTFVTFNFATPPVMNPATTYYLGFAQTANTTLGYFPSGTYGTNYLQPNLFYTNAITGGALTVLPNNFGFFGIEAVLAHSVTVSALSPTLSCGSNAILTASSSTNYSWSTGANTSTIAVTNATATSFYTVSATNTLGCMASKVVTVNVTPIALSVAVSPTLVCAGKAVTLTASGAANFTWTATSGTSSGVSISDTPISNISYSLAGNNPNGCAASTVFVLLVNPLPVLNLASTNGSVCLGNTVTLIGSGTSASYSWSTGQTSSSITFTPSATATYTVFGTSAVGCTKSNTTTVIVDSFTPGITSSTAICNGQGIQLNATGATTLLWSNGSIFASITVTPGATTTYSVIGKSAGNGCIGSAATTITVNPTPTIQASATRTSICRGETAVYTASGAATYSWSTGAITASIALSPTSTILQTYTVTGTNSFNCSTDLLVNLKVNTCSGIAENGTDLRLNIAPNPNTGVFSLLCSDAFVGSTAIIYTINGQEVERKLISQNSTEFNIQTLSQGIYLLKVTAADGSNYSLRLLKN